MEDFEADLDTLRGLQSERQCPEVRVDRLRHDAFETKFAGMLSDKLAVAGFVGVELQARRPSDQRL
jgi:hypothetical protein